MDSNWKRPKEIPSRTEHIELESGCGTLHITLGFEEEVDKKLVEIRCMIGKSGICGNVLLDSFAKTLSIIIQSPLSREKICKKIRKQFIDVRCNQGVSCVDIIARKVLKELE